MPNGDCFHCHKPGHWANHCPLKTPTDPISVAGASPPAIHCPYHGGACFVLTSKTEKNPNRRFYKCPADPSCRFFKWCDQVSIKPEPISDNPTCPCGAGPCRRVTFIDGPNAQRSYFACRIKKGFGACGFFQWEDDARIQVKSEHHGVSPCSTLIGFSGFDSADDESLLHETDLSCDASLKSSSLGVVKDYADTLPVDNAFSVRKKPSISVCTRFKNLESVSSNGVFASKDDGNPKEAVWLEGEEEVLSSLASNEEHIEHQVEALCSDYTTKCAPSGSRGEKSYSGETDHSQDIKDPVTNGRNVTGETGASYLMHLAEQYNSEKLHFSGLSSKHADALAAFTGSYKQLRWLRVRADSLRKQLVEVEKHVKHYEAETTEFATSLEEVCGEMVKSQRKMVETARKVAKEVKSLQAKRVCSFIES